MAADARNVGQTLSNKEVKALGYFDTIVSNSFKTDDDGRDIFFPWGSFGRGYEIPSEAESERLRRILIRMNKTWLPMVFVVPFFPILVSPHWWIIFVLLLPFTAGHVLWVRHLTKGLRRSEVRMTRLTFRENFARTVEAHSMWMLWLGLLILLLNVSLGVLFLVFAPSKWPFGLVLIIVFGIGSLYFGAMLVAKNKQSAE